MDYKDAGVDYNILDEFKVKAQIAGVRTANNLKHFGIVEKMRRGESVYLIERPDCYLAHVEEGLGTKILVADIMSGLADFGFIGLNPNNVYYRNIAQDAVAMIVNDMITLGAFPVSTAMHLAVGSVDWFKNTKRANDLIIGWEKACDIAGCAWGCGETSVLDGIIVSDTAVLSGSAIGLIQPKSYLINPLSIKSGDDIVLVNGSGIHSNGLSLARKISRKVLHGYMAFCSDGRFYGDTLLDPTIIYAPLIKCCLQKGIQIHYVVHITGHGWRKLMRPVQNFTYVVEKIPKPQPIFQFIQEFGGMNDEQMYSCFNMGAGLAIYANGKEVDKILKTAVECQMNAFYAGWIEKSEEGKKVIIKPKNIELLGSSMKIRGISS